MRGHLEFLVVVLQLLCQSVEHIPLKNNTKMWDWYVVPINGPFSTVALVFFLHDVGHKRMAEENEFLKLALAAALLAPEQPPIESTTGFEAVDREGQVEDGV